MFVEVGVELEHSAGLDLVAAAAVEGRVRDEVFDAGEGGEEVQEGLRVQIVHECFGPFTEAVFPFGGQLDLVGIVEFDVGFSCEIRKFFQDFLKAFRDKEIIEVNIGEGIAVLVFGIPGISKSFQFLIR